MKPLFVANWKMNKLLSDTEEFVSTFKELFQPGASADVGIASSYLSLHTLQKLTADVPEILVGAQNVHWEESGAHTGEVSAPMLKDLQIDFAIVGHSERRQFYGESDEGVSKRARAAIAHGLKAIVCVGESETEYREERSSEVVESQLVASLKGLQSVKEAASLVIAYEPIWAIGTGLTASPEHAAKMHQLIRARLLELFGEAAGQSIPILYGGSTKPENIAGLIAQKDVDGALVGGASLDPKVFWELVKNGREAA